MAGQTGKPKPLPAWALLVAAVVCGAFSAMFFDARSDATQQEAVLTWAVTAYTWIGWGLVALGVALIMWWLVLATRRLNRQ